MSYTGKQISLAILPKLSGTLSLLGSAYIFQDVARSRKRRSRPYHRLILALSTYDIVASVVNIMSTWPIPEGTAGVYGAVGNTGTCTAQGFFNETGNITTPLYNCMLCVYYMLVIRNGWSEQRVKRIEPLLHVLPLTVGWSMGIAGLPLTLYNPSGWLCWYAPYPSNCLSDPMVPCERGELAFVFRWLHYAIIWSAIIFVTVGMTLIYRKVMVNEAKTRKFTQHVHPSEKDNGGHGGRQTLRRRLSFINRQEDELRAQQAAASRSRKVANQAMLFVGALYLTWIFTTLTRIFQTVQGKTYYPLLVLMAIFFPLQGALNAIIYLRPRYLKQKQTHPERNCVAQCVAVIQFKDNNNRRDNTEYSISGYSENRRRSFVSKISSAITDRRNSFLNGHVQGNRDKNEESDSPGSSSSEGGEDEDEDSMDHDDLTRLEEAAANLCQRGSVSFAVSTKKFDGKEEGLQEPEEKQEIEAT